MHTLGMTLGIAFVGAWICLRLKLPAGTIVGAILAVAIVNIFWGVAPVPSTAKFLTQVVAGAFIGVSFDRKAVGLLLTLWKPALVMMSCFYLLHISLGYLLYCISPLDLCTALFAVVPGGITEMAVIADDMGADTAIVGVFQIARLIFTICTFPFFITHILRAKKSETPAEKPPKKTENTSALPRWQQASLSMLCAVVAGSLGAYLGIAGGTLLFSVIAVSVLQIRFGCAWVPMWLKRAAQILAGALVGTKMTYEVIQSLKMMWVYVLMVVVVYLFASLGMGRLLSRCTGIDPLTATFSATPAGASDMALIAADFGTVTPTIAALQLVRLVGVIGVCPTLIALILS